MKHIPSDIEQLMWAVAERADPASIDDFERRFPNLKYELGKRLAMVRALRGSKGLGALEGSIPAFRRPHASPPGSRRLVWTVGAFALGAFAVASFYIADQMLRPEIPKRVVGPVEQPRRTPIVERYEGPGGTPAPAPAPAPNVPVEEEPLPKYALAHSVKVENARLEDAIREIGRATGLNVEIAPGLPTDRIRLRYSAMTGLQMLADLGSRFGFTAFDQGEGKVLVIPAIDPAAAGAPGHAPVSPDTQGVKVMPLPSTDPGSPGG